MPNPNPKTDQLTNFKKGYDPRRNLRGVPKDALALKKRIEQIGAELLVIEEKVKIIDPETGKPKYVEAVYELSRYDAMLRMMYSSKAPADRKEILERTGGKVPQAVTVGVGNPDGSKLEIEIVDKTNDELNRSIAKLASVLGSLAQAGGGGIPGGAGGASGNDPEGEGE